MNFENIFNKLLFEQILSPAVIVDLDQKILFSNRAFALLSGFNHKRIKTGNSLSDYLAIPDLCAIIEKNKGSDFSTGAEELNGIGKNEMPVKLLIKVIPNLEDGKPTAFTLTMIDVTVESKLHKDYKNLAFEKEVRHEAEQRFLISNTLLPLRSPAEVLKNSCTLLANYYPGSKYVALMENKDKESFLLVSTHPKIDIEQICLNNNIPASFFANAKNDSFTSLVKTIFDEEDFILKSIRGRIISQKALILVIGIKNKTLHRFHALDEFIGLISNAFENASLFQLQLKYEKQLEHARKMETVGKLAGGIAHNLNNILSGLVGYPQMLLLDLAADSPIRETILIIKNAGEAAADLVQDLLLVTKHTVMTMTACNINNLIKLLSRDFRVMSFLNKYPNINLELDLKKNLPYVLCSKSHIFKGLFNIICNSFEAIGNTKGTISLKTTLMNLNTPLENYKDVIKGEYVTVEISDTGTGMHEENRQRIFEPFFTTKKMGNNIGTGLGLSISWSILEEHKAYVKADSKPGEGTVLTIYFPAMKDKFQNEVIKVSPGSYNTKGNEEIILLIDDNRERGESKIVILQNLNYKVLLAPSIKDAINMLNTTKVDLVLVNITCIIENNYKFNYLDGIREIHTMCKTALISENNLENQSYELLKYTFLNTCLKKPYLIEELAIFIKQHFGSDYNQ